MIAGMNTSSPAPKSSSPASLALAAALLLPALAPVAAAQDGGPADPYRRVVVDVTGATAGVAHELDLDVVAFTWDGSGLVLVAQDRDLAALDEAGLPYRIEIPDLEAWYASRLQPSPVALGAVGGSITPPFAQGDIGGYHSYAEIGAILDQLAAQYPQYVAPKVSLGLTIEGRDIWAQKISDNPLVDEAEPEVRFDAMHHAREPMSMETTLYFAAWLLENAGVDPLADYLLAEREIWIVPCVNPDGYVYNETTNPNGGGMWRKNRRDNPGSFDGVDINRNYTYQWGFDDSGSSPSTFAPDYRGPSPASEPETQAMEAFMASRSFRTALSSHSYSNLWLAAWGFDDMFPPDHVDISEIGALATATNGFPFGPAFVILYPANGVTVDQDYGVHDTFSWAPEIGSFFQGFWPQTSDIVPLADSLLEGFQVTALAAGPFVRQRGAVLVDLGDGDGDFEPGETVGVVVNVRNSGRGAGTASVFATSSDPELSVTNGVESLGSVAAFSAADNAGAPLLLTIDPGATPGTVLDIDFGADWDGPDSVGTKSLTVGVPEPGQWTDLGGGSPGVNGVPTLGATGTLVAGQPFQIDLVDAAPTTPMLAWLSFSSTPFAALGGTVHAFPFASQFPRTSDAAGALSEGGPWPAGVLSGTDLWLQFIVQDLSVPAGLVLSNAVTATTP